ncbi:GIY-YIG nuclease family protein [Segnochrobactrum spirostomi]|uniref:GIY-YIG nuclease family protein n=1 Tax=Segnochrobactrum spirostomi TaxID=2608987 RepID=A0A6A7XY33_9HYPH|nr:GIY-YIG nuclease family protein [Segnochrobactrum spirostomi]MQT11345.1 GIY-YIG nuclease family protein [Segnochrobactrum spirostomi]
MTGWVYIVTNKPQGTFYVGVTNDIARRTYEHRTTQYPSFTSRYRLFGLVWYEPHDAMPLAIHREKRLKKWPRVWKINLIETFNPEWLDLYETLNA